ncbi:MAG: ral secretion pathway protein [Candidatus Binatota bacterium]|jgi:general secretion pathway protein F|nr:ral secretion pathway protein [Candidatus Binatota bacterium]
MPVYAYSGLSPQGKSVSGIVDAENPRVARQKLRKSGVYPTALNETEGAQSRREGPTIRRSFERVNPQDLAVMTRQLSTLVGAGLPLVESIGALVEQVDSDRLKRILSHIRELVTEGTSLADALGQHPRVFGDLYVNMVRAGEASGALDVVLLRLADYTEATARLRSKVRKALTYPIFMVVVGTLILFFLLTYVVPKVTRIFTDTKQVLPLATRILIGTSNFLAEWWWLFLAGAVLAGVGLRAYARTPSGRIVSDRWKLRAPVFGKLAQKIAVARFARTLSTLLRSGIGLLPSLDIVKNIVDNRIVFQAIEDARDAIREGQPIAPPLKRSGIFPPLMTHMIAVGERSGQLEDMLAKAADGYEDEVDTTVSTLTTLLEPIMILVMGATVLFIVLAILLPIFQMSQIVH